MFISAFHFVKHPKSLILPLIIRENILVNPLSWIDWLSTSNKQRLTVFNILWTFWVARLTLTFDAGTFANILCLKSVFCSLLFCAFVKLKSSRDFPHPCLHLQAKFFAVDLTFELEKHRGKCGKKRWKMWKMYFPPKKRRYNAVLRRRWKMWKSFSYNLLLV